MAIFMMLVKLETIPVKAIQKFLQKKMLKNLFYKLKNSLMKWKLYYDFSNFFKLFILIFK